MSESDADWSVVQKICINKDNIGKDFAGFDIGNRNNRYFSKILQFFSLIGLIGLVRDIS